MQDTREKNIHFISFAPLLLEKSLWVTFFPSLHR